MCQFTWCAACTRIPLERERERLLCTGSFFIIVPKTPMSNREGETTGYLLMVTKKEDDGGFGGLCHVCMLEREREAERGR